MSQRPQTTVRYQFLGISFIFRLPSADLIYRRQLRILFAGVVHAAPLWAVSNDTKLALNLERPPNSVLKVSQYPTAWDPDVSIADNQVEEGKEPGKHRLTNSCITPMNSTTTIRTEAQRLMTHSTTLLHIQTGISR